MNLWLDSFVFGAANSLHCACMCGPLALMMQGDARCAFSYHAGRTIAYGAMGVALGGLGAVLGSQQLSTPASIVAFVMAAGLIVLVVVGDRGVVRLPFVADIVPKVTARTRHLSAAKRAGLLGVVTPLLPCGLLWSVFAGASVAGSTLGGAAVMTGFAMGSLPLLFFAQSQAGRFAQRFGPRTMRLVQNGAMLLAAGVLVWRGYANLGDGTCCP